MEAKVVAMYVTVAETIYVAVYVAVGRKIVAVIYLAFYPSVAHGYYISIVLGNKL
jgi:hypothetical protein